MVAIRARSSCSCASLEGCRTARAPPHRGVHVHRERHRREPGSAVGIEHDRFEVVVVEVAVGEAHRDTTVPAHGGQGLRVCVGRQQRDLTADQLCVLARSPVSAQVGHLPIDLCDRVRPVHGHPVGLAAVVARRAPEVAGGEHPVGPLASRQLATQQLRRCPHAGRQLVPASRVRGRDLGIVWPCRDLQVTEPLAQLHGTSWVSASARGEPTPSLRCSSSTTDDVDVPAAGMGGEA